jgi:hypothetical protein
LTINDFPNLIEIKRSDEDVNYKKDIYKITKLIITNCPSLEKVNINGFRDNEELVLSEVPNLIELRCRFNQLTNLDLSQCNNLQVLNCGKNKLTNLDLSNCSNLTGIYCYDNLLAKLDFLLHLNPQKLEGLGLESNNFTKQNLTFFRRFTNLQYLYLGNENK